jgi:hypothetical protein
MERGTPLNDITNQIKAQTDLASEKSVTKRNGQTQLFDVEKIKNRLSTLTEGLAAKHINIDLITAKVVQQA